MNKEKLLLDISQSNQLSDLIDEFEKNCVVNLHIKLKKKRLELGLPIKKVSQDTEISISSIRRLESGKNCQIYQHQKLYTYYESCRV